MTVRLSVAVQHHPARAHLLPALVARLGPDVEVVADPDPDAPLPSPWRCYLECLRRTPGWATHRLVVQDDAEAADGFIDAAVAALEARPGSPVAFWVGGWPPDNCTAMRRAANLGRAWTDLSAWQIFPCVCSAWPVDIAAQIVGWADRPGNPAITRSDDNVLGTFLSVHRIVPYATVPSLVEHPDRTPSLIGKPARGGADRNRVGCLPPAGRDLSTIAW